MGAVTSYKRNGHGLLLLDDGSSLLTEHCFDTITGHNVLFRENCIASLLFHKNSHEVVLRTGQCVVKLPFPEREELPTGSGLLVDYQAMKAYHLLFHAGRLVRKIAETNRRLLDQLMRQELRAVMDERHEAALKLNPRTSSGVRVLREGRRITVGFVDGRQQLEGVGFKLRVNEDYDDFSRPLELKCVERGLYIRSRL